MYLKTILCAIVILVTTAALKQEKYKLSPEKLLAAKKFSLPCEEEFHVDSSFLAKIVDGTLPQDDEATKKYLYCFTINGGFVKEDGHIVVDRIASFLDNHPLVEEFKEALRNCNKITKENHLETVMAMNACINNTAPVLFSVV